LGSEYDLLKHKYICTEIYFDNGEFIDLFTKLQEKVHEKNITASRRGRLSKF